MSEKELPACAYHMGNYERDPMIGTVIRPPVHVTPPQGGESALCPPGFAPRMTGPGRYECVPIGIPLGMVIG